MIRTSVPVLRLKVKHIDSADKIVRVEQSKGRKDRNVMLSSETLDLLRQWWKVRASRHPTDDVRAFMIRAQPIAIQKLAWGVQPRLRGVPAAGGGPSNLTIALARRSVQACGRECSSLGRCPW